VGWAARASRWCLADRLVEPSGFFQRRHPELAPERSHALAILGQRGGAVARARVQADQRAVRGLVERVELDPAAGVCEGLHGVSGGVAFLDEAREDDAELAGERVGLRALPVLEARCVAQPEAFHEGTPEHLDRFGVPAFARSKS
jgi:hypothetical protein